MRWWPQRVPKRSPGASFGVVPEGVARRRVPAAGVQEGVVGRLQEGIVRGRVPVGSAPARRAFHCYGCGCLLVAEVTLVVGEDTLWWGVTCV